MIFTSFLSVAIALASLSAYGADGAGETFRTHLIGFEEVPSIFTAANGQVRVTIHDNQIEYELKYSGLTTPAIASHIHLGQKSVNGGIMAFLCGGDDKPACPPGTTDQAVVTGVITAANIRGPVAQNVQPGDFEAAKRIIREGFGYVNVHSEKFPGGEIRGQLR